MSNRRTPNVARRAPGLNHPHPDTPDVAAWREEQRRERAGHHGVNAWKCDRCGFCTVAIDVDPGVTPMFLACRRTPGCTGTGVSSGYPDAPIPPALLAHLDWEWRRATEREYRLASAAMGDHLDKGGLMIVPRTDRPSAYIGVPS